MRAHRSVTLLLLVAAFAMTGCYTRARGRATFSVNYSVPSEVVVSAEPPPLQAAVEVRPAPPAQDAVWVEGHYKWEGQWVWVEGHWEAGRRGYVWVAPVATRRGGRVVYHPGHWRPADQPPPRVYRDPGPVRVAVRRPPPSSGGAVHVRSPEGGTTHVRTPSGGGTTTARTPSGGGTTTARTPSRGGTTARTPGGRGSVTARTPSGDVNRADDSVARARPGDEQRPTVRAEDRQSGRAPNQHPTVRAEDRQTGNAPSQHRTPAQRGRVDDRSTGPGQVQDRAFTCAIDTPRAPEGGLITITGAFGSGARVMIGGQNAAVVNRAQGRMRARVPGSSGGGMVRVVEGGRSANCGTISISSR